VALFLQWDNLRLLRLDFEEGERCLSEIDTTGWPSRLPIVSVRSSKYYPANVEKSADLEVFVMAAGGSGNKGSATAPSANKTLAMSVAKNDLEKSLVSGKSLNKEAVSAVGERGLVSAMKGLHKRLEKAGVKFTPGEYRSQSPNLRGKGAWPRGVHVPMEIR
jgi:hypothetical protein